MKFFKIALLLLIFSVFAGAAGISVRAEGLEKVTIAQFGKERFLLYLPLYIAMEDGIFAKHGLDVSLNFAGNDDQIFAAVIGGSADFGMGDPVFAAISHDHGGPGKVVAMMITRLGLSGYTNKPEIAPIETPEQLDGLRITSFPEPSTTYTLLSALKRDHAPGMTIVQAAFGAQLATLETGAADIAVDIEPTVSIAEDQGYPVVFDFEEFNAAPQAITGIMTIEETIAERPETVQKLVSALQEAMTLLHTDREASLRTARKIYPNLKESVVAAAVDRMLRKDMYPDSIVVQDDYWQRSLQTRLDSGNLSKPQDTTVAVDNSFALKALAQAVPAAQ